MRDALVDRLRAILLAPLCLHCGGALPAVRPALCAGCRAAIEAVPAARCRRCGLPHPGSPDSCGRCRHWPAGLQATAAVRYAGPARSLVRGLKYGGFRHLAELCAIPLAPLVVGPPDVLVPVPLHPARLRARGFNQSGLLAAALGGRIDRPVEDALARIRRTRSQVGLGRGGRARNVSRAFVARRALDGARVGLVDDVATSGATLAAAAAALLEAGAGGVLGLTYALALDPGAA